MVKWLGREAAQWPHLLGAVLILITPFLNLTTDQTGAVMAGVVALTGGATALSASGEKAAPLAAGLLKAVVALSLAIHLELSPGAQAAVMVLIEAGVAWYLRTQIVAPVPPLPVQTLPVTQIPTPPVPVTVAMPAPLPVEVVTSTNTPAAYITAAAAPAGHEDVQIVHAPQTDASFLDSDIDPLHGPRHGGPPLP